MDLPHEEKCFYILSFVLWHLSTEDSDYPNMRQANIYFFKEVIITGRVTKFSYVKTNYIEGKQNLPQP